MRGLDEERSLAGRHPRTPFFEYLGATGLTVYCPATGRRYSFGSAGAVVAVDPRDEPALLTVPHLRKIAPQGS